MLRKYHIIRYAAGGPVIVYNLVLMYKPFHSRITYAPKEDS